MAIFPMSQCPKKHALILWSHFTKNDYVPRVVFGVVKDETELGLLPICYKISKWNNKKFYKTKEANEIIRDSTKQNITEWEAPRSNVR